MALKCGDKTEKATVGNKFPFDRISLKAVLSCCGCSRRRCETLTSTSNANWRQEYASALSTRQSRGRDVKAQGIRFVNGE